MKNHSKAVCLICESKDDLILLHKSVRSSHKLCLSCLEKYIQPYIKNFYSNHKIKTDLTFPCCGDWKCRRNNECKQLIELNKLSIPEQSNLYTDLLKIQLLKHKHTSMCPNCTNVILVNINYIGKIECSCGQSYCRGCGHSPYHEEKSCAQNTLHISSDPDVKFISELIRRKLVKLCPHCQYPIEKDAGCNKMKCDYCHCIWCWLCEKTISDYDHFSLGQCQNKLWILE